MKDQLITYKNIGETPLEALERTRIEYSIGAGVPMTYAGRLDPLAEGMMIILVGEACKTKDQYNKLGKTYEFEILSGFSTDTYDLLGIVTDSDFSAQLDIENVKKYLTENKKTITQQYPAYSSKTFEGKQLHAQARQGNTPTVEHEVTLHDFEFLGKRTISGEELLKIILERVDLVHGDFRQEEIKGKWKEILADNTGIGFQVSKWRVDVSAGFYIRQLVSDIGKKFTIPTVTFHIKRTQIDEFDKTLSLF